MRLRADLDDFPQFLADKNMTYKDLARGAKVAPATVTNFLKMGCRDITVRKLAKALDVTNWLTLVRIKDRNAYLHATDSGYFGWAALEAAAKKIGAILFDGDFKANIILTFSGHSWIFASLVLAYSLSRNRILDIPIYVALTMDWEPSDPMPRVAGFTTIPGPEPTDETRERRFVVLIPNSFPKADPDGKRHVAVIDDCITSGAVHLVVNNYLRKLKYRRGEKGTARTACCVCNTSATLLAKPDHYAIPSRREKFSYPWGECVWFTNRSISIREPIAVRSDSPKKNGST